MSATTSSVSELWNQVRHLPTNEKLSLATRILRSLEHGADGDHAPKKSLADLVGIMANDQPPPTDAEVEAILESERERKCG